MAMYCTSVVPQTICLTPIMSWLQSKVIKSIGSDALIPDFYKICKKIKSNLFCRYHVNGEAVTFEGVPEQHICGYNECNLYKLKQGADVENNNNRCHAHNNLQN